MARTAFAFVLAALCMPAALVHAQSRDNRPDASIGVGYTSIWYPELGFGGLSIAGGVRLPVSPLVAIEPEFIVARHAQDRTFGAGQDLVAETRSRKTTWSAGLNAIVSGRRGPVRPFAGGGVAIHGGSSSFETVVPPPRPNAGAFRTDRSDAPSFGVQGIAGVDIPVSSRASVFGAFRADFRNAFGVSLGFHYLAGTRLRF